ncbi:MAG: peptide chain release factor subunit 1 [Patescibacteria group bacterium]|jgi:peptide chain release factor subunit 1
MEYFTLCLIYDYRNVLKGFLASAFMEVLEPISKYELELLLEELESYRGRHTEFITVYVPAGFTLTQVTKQLEDEKGTATNIKSNTTRKNVILSLEKCIRRLKDIERTPENGIVLFAGNVADAEGKEDLQVWTIVPPKPMKMRVYRCDQTFVLEPLQDMLVTDEVYGLLVIERNEASIGILEGKNVRQLSNFTSGIPGKTKAGGQSAQRFSRIRDSMAKEFYKRIAEKMKEAFFDNKKLKGILVGGPMPTKEDFLDKGMLVTELKKKVIAVKDLGDSGIKGLIDLVRLSEDVLMEQEVTKQKKILDEFFSMLAKDPDKVSYGMAEVRDRLDRGAVAKLIISKSLDRKVIKELEKLAETGGAEVHIVSDETTEGVQFDNLGSIGGLLRFAIMD